jgi:HEAT repeat protein
MTTPRQTRSRLLLTGGAFVFALATMSGLGVDLRAQTPAPTPTLDQILKEVSTYDGGIESPAMWKLRDYVYARKDSDAGRAECAAKLLQFLKTTATPVAKMAACRYLRVIGGDTAVPPLEAMLADERSADMALYALQQIPGDAAEGALVRAVKTTSGATRIAVIGALGERRDPAAIAALVPLLQQPAVGTAAAIALGRIGGDEAAAALVSAYASAPPDFKRVFASSILACADAWLAAKNTASALRLYEPLSNDMSLPVPQRRAAGMGRILSAGTNAATLLADMLGGSDPVIQDAAIARIADVIPPDQIAPVCALLLRLPDGAQVQLLAVLSGYPAERVLPTILQAAGSDVVSVRVAALQALELTGGPSVVPLLAQTAATARGPEQSAARSTLGMLKGRAVDEAILALAAQHKSDDIDGELLLAIGDRRIFAAKGVVTAGLTARSPNVRTQALKALRAIGTPSDMSAVLDVLLASAGETERADAEKTIVALAQKIAAPDGRSQRITARLAGERNEKRVEAQVRLIGILPLIGDSTALPALRSALADSEPEVFDAAVRAFTAWPTSAARDDILRLAQDSRNETHRLLAIGALVRTVRLDTYRDPEAAVADLRLAAALAWRPEEYKLVLGALALFPCKAALDLATGFLREPSVKEEAQAAKDKITARLEKTAARK